MLALHSMANSRFVHHPSTTPRPGRRRGRKRGGEGKKEAHLRVEAGWDGAEEVGESAIGERADVAALAAQREDQRHRRRILQRRQW